LELNIETSPVTVLEAAMRVKVFMIKL